MDFMFLFNFSFIFSFYLLYPFSDLAFFFHFLNVFSLPFISLSFILFLSPFSPSTFSFYFSTLFSLYSPNILFHSTFFSFLTPVSCSTFLLWFFKSLFFSIFSFHCPSLYSYITSLSTFSLYFLFKLSL